MAFRRILPGLVSGSIIAVLMAGGTARAQDAGDVVDVVEVNGLIDARLVDFVLGVVESTDAAVVVLQIDSPGAVDGEIIRLIDGIGEGPIPVAVWVGPAPAVAQGGALQLLLAAPIRSAAPRVLLGFAVPTVAGGGDDTAAVRERFPDLPEEMISSRVEVTAPIEGVVDLVTPSIGQLVVGIDGMEIMVGGQPRSLVTARTVSEGGLEVVTPAGDVRFRKPGLVDRTLRIAVRPEAAFLLMMIGLALIVFEFYAAGPGVAAAVGVGAILLAGYGMATLPVNWWAVLFAVLGVALYVVDFQRHSTGLPSLAGTALMLAGGLMLTRGAPQVRVVWWAVVLVVAFTALFFGAALRAVARARFSTPTIGRDRLMGRRGRAETALDPEGVVVVDEARWRGRARRGAGLGPGDPIEVVGIDGVLLEVEPAPGPTGSRITR